MDKEEKLREMKIFLSQHLFEKNMFFISKLLTWVPHVKFNFYIVQKYAKMCSLERGGSKDGGGVKKRRNMLKAVGGKYLLRKKGGGTKEGRRRECLRMSRNVSKVKNWWPVTCRSTHTAQTRYIHCMQF